MSNSSPPRLERLTTLKIVELPLVTLARDDQPAARDAHAQPTAASGPALAVLTRAVEERYMLAEPAAFERVLRAHAEPIEYVAGQPQSWVTTVYVDTVSGTWTRKRSKPKLRCRNYGDPEAWWFELKSRDNGAVDKLRRPVDSAGLARILAGRSRWDALTDLVGKLPLVPVVGVRYCRTAFEWPGLRVTIDRDLSCHVLDESEPWSFARPVSGLFDAIVEVKGDGDLPEWLTAAVVGRRVDSFSKSKWARVACGAR